MSNIILLYEADNLSITGEYEFIQEVIEKTHGTEESEEQIEDSPRIPESHSINAYISILVNGKLKVFGLSFPFKRYNFDSHQGKLYINGEDAKTGDRYSVADYTLFNQFINIMQGMGYMSEANESLIDTWVDEFTKNKKG